MKITDLTTAENNIKLFSFMDFDGTFKEETKDINEFINQSKEVILLDKKVPFIKENGEELYDLIYIKFKEDSKFMNCLYLGRILPK